MSNNLKILQTTNAITEDSFHFADEQAGAKVSERPLPAETNIGDFILQMFGFPDDPVNTRIEIVDAGTVLTGRYRYSPDGGSTFKGRKVIGYWDAGIGTGAAGSGVKIFDATVEHTFTQVVYYDNNDDDLPEEAVVGIYNTDTSVLKIYYTEDLTLKTGWNLRYTFATLITTGTPRFGLVERDNTLYIAYNDNGTIFCKSSINGGSGWGSTGTLQTGVSNDTSVDITVKKDNNWLMVVYVDVAGEIQIRGSANGVTWYGGGNISTTGKEHPTIAFNKNTGLTTVFANTVSTGGVVAWEIAYSQPWKYGNNISYSQTFNLTDTKYKFASHLIAHDGSVWVIAMDTTDDDIKVVCSPAGGSGTWSKPYQVTKISGHISKYPSISSLGGALFCVFNADNNPTSSDAYISMQKYWVDYSEGTSGGLVFTGTGTNDIAKASVALYTGAGDNVDYLVRTATSGENYRYSDDAQDNWSGSIGFHTATAGVGNGVNISWGTSGPHAPDDYWEFTYHDKNSSWLSDSSSLLQHLTDDDVWVSWGGNLGAAGDYWDQETSYDYGMVTIIKGIPELGWRSTSVNTSGRLGIILKGKDSDVFSVNTMFFGGCNTNKLTIEAADSDSFPGTHYGTVDFSTGDVGSVGSVGASFITDNANTIKAHSLKDKMIMMDDGAASGYVYRIADNTLDGVTSEIFLSSGSVASDGVLADDSYSILDTKQWKVLETKIRKQYLGIFVPVNTSSPDPYHKIGAMVAGTKLDVEKYPNIDYRKSDIHAESLNVTQGGKVYAFKVGNKRRSFSYMWNNLTVGDKDGIVDYFNTHGYSSKPMAILDIEGDPYLVRLINKSIGWSGKPASHYDISSLEFEEQN